MNKSLLNRYVRYIYRKMMKTYGVQKVREEALKIYVLTTREKGNLKEDTFCFSDEFKAGVYDLLRGWNIPLEYISEEIEVIGTSEILKEKLKDLTPIRIRIRKLTPTECLSLMGVHGEDIEKMKESGLSNSALYKLAGNSIVTNCLEGIFRQLFRKDTESLF